MMDDLISRQAAIDALAEQMPTPYTPDGSHPADEQIFQVQEVYVDCITTIKLLPTIQPEPQEGHWIWVVGDLECSKCHTRYPDLYPDYDNSVACPHCGARMKGEQNETD